MEFARSWIEKSPYTVALGVELDHLDENGARLRLPFREANSNLFVGMRNTNHLANLYLLAGEENFDVVASLDHEAMSWAINVIV